MSEYAINLCDKGPRGARCDNRYDTGHKAYDETYRTRIRVFGCNRGPGDSCPSLVGSNHDESSLASPQDRSGHQRI